LSKSAGDRAPQRELQPPVVPASIQLKIALSASRHLGHEDGE
jgi:hypothetical protein